MRVVVGCVGSVLLAASLSCSKAPEVVEEPPPAPTKPVVEAPKFAVVVPRATPTVPRAFARPTPTPTATPSATAPVVNPAVGPLDLAQGTFEGRPIQMTSIADGYPVTTVQGADAKTVMLVRPGSESRSLYAIEELGGRFKRITMGSTQLLTTADWKPGMDLYLSPLQMFEAFPPSTSPSASGPVDVKSVTLTNPDTIVPLPGEVFDVSVGDRFLLLSMRSPNRVVVVDIAAGKVAATIPIEDEVFYVAGGADRFYVAVPLKREVNSYSFENLAQAPKSANEAGRLKFHQQSRAIAMGRDSLGPLMIHDSEGLGFFSIDTTLERDVIAEKYGTKFSSKNPKRLSVRNDGSAFYLGTDEGGVREYRFYREIKQAAKDGKVSYLEYDFEQPLVAAKQDVLSRTDGTGLYVYGDRELCFRNGLRVGNRSRYNTIVPCSPAGFWLAAGPASLTDSVIGVDVFCGDDPAPLETIYLTDGGKLSEEPKQLPLRDRIVHFAKQKKLAIVTTQPARVLLKSLNPEEAFQAAKRPTLMVTSTAPLPLFTPKQKLKYQIQTTASPVGTVTYKLMMGPPELTVSPEGLVDWQPNEMAANPTTPESDYALVKITDASGKYVYERLDLTIKRQP